MVKFTLKLFTFAILSGFALLTILMHNSNKVTKEENEAARIKNEALSKRIEVAVKLFQSQEEFCKATNDRLSGIEEDMTSVVLNQIAIEDHNSMYQKQICDNENCIIFLDREYDVTKVYPRE